LTTKGGNSTPMTLDQDARLAQLEQENARLRERLAATQHRVRNALAVIRVIARRSAETSETVEDYAMHLDGRIGAVARVQGALLRDPTEGMTLETLVADVMLSVAAREGDRVLIKGPALTLRTKAAELLGQAMHELATNAVKFGALSWPQGRITVSWRRADKDGARLTLTWTETGAPGEVRAARRGFGTEMLERMLNYELGARTELDFAEPGLVCRIELPWDAVCVPA
jgi:two-component system CheB/CheR fusion protein